MVEDEMQNTTRDKENFLDKAQLKADSAKLTQIVKLNRVGNNKTKIWKPSKVDIKAMGINLDA